MGYWENYALSRGEDPDDIRREAAMDTEGERKGASYSIKSRHAAGDYSGHEQAPHHEGKTLSGRGPAHERFPRMTSMMRTQGSLSTGEAESAIGSLAEGRENYGEAVSHYGGVQRLAADAFRNRNTVTSRNQRFLDSMMRSHGHGGI